MLFGGWPRPVANKVPTLSESCFVSGSRTERQFYILELGLFVALHFCSPPKP